MSVPPPLRAAPVSRGNAMPFVRCPACAAVFELDDYYRVDVGSELECSHCHAELEVTERECLMYCDVAIKTAKPQEAP